jgi:D-arabinose 1-dehydrogenase-like Zn-dependent alcohol dehydrogenase
MKYLIEQKIIFQRPSKSEAKVFQIPLNRNGSFTSSNGAINFLLIPITKLPGGKKVVFSSFRTIKAALDSTKELIEKGKFKPVIDRIYPLDQIAEAYRYVATGQKIGNVIILWIIKHLKQLLKTITNTQHVFAVAGNE